MSDPSSSSAPPIDGTDGNDTLNGTEGSDLIRTGNGVDQVNAGAGDDSINAVFSSGDTWSIYRFGGAKLIDGGNGRDLIAGGDNNDTLAGGADDDTIDGLDGDDSITGGSGSDTLVGRSGHDTLSGDDGSDLLFGDQGQDSLNGGAGHDTLDGGDDDDRLYGGADADSLIGGAGHDHLDGGEGDDTLAGMDGDDSGHGGEGADTLIGGSGRDSLTGDDGNDLLLGDQGQDSLDGGAGHDKLDGGDDGDRLYGGADADSLIGNAGDDYLDGGSGDDTLIAGTGRDTLIGGEGNDGLFSRSENDPANDGGNLLDGGQGDDTLYGGGDDDTLDGGAGRNLLIGGAGNDHYLIGSAETRVVEQDGAQDSALVMVDFFKRPSGLETFELAPGVARLPYWIDGLIPADASGRFFDSLVGNGREIYFAFPSTPPDYLDPSDPAVAADFHEFEEFSDVQKTAARAVFVSLEGVLNLRFREVLTTDAANVIALANNEQSDSAGYARFPSDQPEGSDVFLSLDLSQGNANPAAGTYGALTLIHEISHALGLKHPFKDAHETDDTEATLPKPDESVRWTVMSYDNQGEGNQSFWVSQLRPLDVAALHYLYGPSPRTRAANDTYSFGESDPNQSTNATLISVTQPNFIWDGGGYDQITLAQAPAAVTLALEPGYRGWIGEWAASITAPAQITVNFGTQIEALIGSAFDDRLFGNALDNLIEGGSGDDEIAGGAGNDLLTGDQGNDSLAGGAGDDTLAGGAGADRLSGGTGNDRFEQIGSGDTVFGGAGIDEAVFNAPSNEFRVRKLGTGDATQWLVDRAQTGWATATLSGIERLVFSDRTLETSSLDTGALAGPGTGLVWHLGSRTVLGGPQPTAPATDQSITAADVLATLKLSAGRPLGLSGSGSGLVDDSLVSAYQRLAADVDGDGAVTAHDAQRVLNRAVGGSTSSTDAQWVFVAENASASGILSGAPDAIVAGNSLPNASTHNWVALVRGDIDGSWRPASGHAFTELPEGFIRSLAEARAVEPEQWGLPPITLQPASDVVIQLDPLMLA